MQESFLIDAGRELDYILDIPVGLGMQGMVPTPLVMVPLSRSALAAPALHAQAQPQPL